MIIKKLLILTLFLFIVSSSHALEKISVAAPSAQVCESFHKQLEKIISLPVSLEKNQISKTFANVEISGSTCQYQLQATGDILEPAYAPNPLLQLPALLTKKLAQDGWKQNTQLTLNFAADGIDGTQFALQKNHQLLVMNLKLMASDKNCPKDQPTDYFSNCGLAPKDRKYQFDILLTRIK